jgi:hypothetical protein
MPSGERDALRREGAVLNCRCAWHPQDQGYPRLSGIVSWRGWGVRVTDGICESCLARFRAEHRRFLEKPQPAGPVAASATTAAPADAVA